MLGFLIAGLVVGCFIGFCWGNSRRGYLVKHTTELPNGFMRIVSTDKISSVLEEISIRKRRFLVSTEVFGGKPVRPSEVVRKIKSDKERKQLEIPILGYPPLVKDGI